MIKLTLPDKPDKLTQEEKNLTDEFRNNPRKSVWSKAYIRDLLIEMTNRKCSYCEAKLGQESKSITIDHYHCKQKYPQKVVEWENLLPCCSRCNSRKSSYDVEGETIIKPTTMEPKSHLKYKSSRYRHKDEIGKKTITVLHLNDFEKLVPVRFKLVQELNEKLEFLHEKKEDGFSVRNGIESLLRTCQPDKEYSAILSTELVNDEYYIALREVLKEEGLWTSEIDQLHSNCMGIAWE